jgi:putative membrane protein
MKIPAVAIMLTTAFMALTPHLKLSPDTDFLNTASQANLAEIAAAKAALSRTRSSAVRSFANTMNIDHTKAQKELQELAKAQGVALATAPDTEHEHMVAALLQMSGRKLDSAYMQGQLLDHEVAVKLFQQEATGGHDSVAKAYAAKYLPRLQHHLKMLRDWKSM